MAKLKEEFWKTLQDLKEDEFDQFKSFLKENGIPVAQLEKAKRQDTVDLMVQRYPVPGARKVTMKILEKIGRNDLVQHFQNFNNDVAQEEAIKRKNPKLKWVQQFAVDVNLDPDTAHPNLILSDDGKQVHHGDVRKTLAENPKRFYNCVNVLGEQGFSSGKSYFEVQVKGKTAWTVGVAKESINRGKSITLSPEKGYWTLWLRNEDEYVANDNLAVHLSLSHHPQKVGVFVDYEKGRVSFYDVDAADLLYSFSGCSFTEKIYPYVSPCTNDGGINSAPLIILPVSPSGQKEDRERKKVELMSVQQFAVEVTLDPDTAHPNLILSGDGKQVHHDDVRKTLPENPQRFYNCVNVLGEQGFSSGKFYFEVQVKGKTAWTVGVAKESINRGKNITLCPENGYWTMCLKNDDEYKAIDNPLVQLSLNHPPQKVGVFVNYEEALVSFYDVDAADLLHSFTGCSFNEKIYPFFSPCTNDGGINSAPLIISPVSPSGQKEDLERKKAELMSVQQFAVEVTLDPDTAHPNLILSGDGKQVHHGDVRKTLPENPKRFYNCVNVLGEQGLSSGKSYFEVQVKGKTAWTVGVAKESINRGKNITLSPEKGYWTLWLRNEDEYVANDNLAVHLSLSHHPQKVGVFVDYEKGRVSFYDVDAADLLYSFSGCSFTEKIYPYVSPCTNDGGINSAPLIILPVSPSGQKEDRERKKVELMSVQQFAVEVTLDPDTAHPNLILSGDGKQVHHDDVRKTLPENPQRFYNCVNVLGEQGFSSGKSYFEVQVKGKTAWTVGVAKESINRGKNITLSPEKGYWTLWLRNEDEYVANDNLAVHLSLSHHPQKVGVFVDYEKGRVSFYDVDAADLLYSFSGCSFTEKIYPFVSPCTNDGGINSAPLIISPVSTSGQKEDRKRKKAELMSVQQFAVEVTLDPDTAHPNLILSGDGKQVHHDDVKKTLPENPQRFYNCVNVLGEQGFSSGKSYFEVQVKGKTAWTVGMAKESINRGKNITLCPENGYWTMCLKNDDEYKAIDNPLVQLSLNHPPQKVGVFVDYEKGEVSFYDVDAADLLHSFTGCSFNEKIYPFFSPCTNDGGINSAPLIISPVSPSGQKEDRKRKKAELMSVQQFAVEVTLDPDTAHPNLILSGDGKQVHHDDVKKTLPENPQRFYNCVNVLGEQGFSSGKSYFEVQVKGKTAWTVGVAKESINRGKNITLCPENGYWTMCLKNDDEYKAIDNPLVQLSLNHPPQKVGVFVNYEEALVSFYDVDAADLLYSFAGCSFNEKIYPFFSPCTNDGGINSAPLIISPVNRPLNLKKQEFGDQKEYERKKAELMTIQQFAVEVTLDPDTAHPALILWDDRKQVSCGDVYKNLPDNAKRFRKCVTILGKQSFSSGKLYFEVQVKGKTAWTVGVAQESINRGKNITLCPENGYWTMWLRKEDEYLAHDNPAVHLSLSHHPQKVGVFVDYEKGEVSFYDVDAADLLYSFTGCSFTGKIYPFFSPCKNDSGKKSASLITSLVNRSMNIKKHEFDDQKPIQPIQQFAEEEPLDSYACHVTFDGWNDRKQEVTMSSVWEELLETLDDLSYKELDQFKLVLQRTIMKKGLPRMSRQRIETADGDAIVEMMMEMYKQQSVEVTSEVLMEMKRSDLVKRLSDFSSGFKGPSRSLDHEYCEVILISSNWTKLEPEVNSKDADEAPTYSLQSEAGKFECSLSGLRWICKGKVSFQYQFCPWEEPMERMKSMQYMAAGPLMNITVIAGKLDEVHLPHWICIDDNPAILDKFAVLHIDDCGDVVENVSEVTSSHVKLCEPVFSPRAVLMKVGFSVKINCNVLIYKTDTAFLTLHVYLIPRDPGLQQELDKREISYGYKVIRKPHPEKSLKIKDRFILTAVLEGTEIHPEDLKLRYESRTPNFFEVYTKNPDTDFALQLNQKMEHQPVWTCTIREDEYQSIGHVQGEHFVDKHWCDLIERVSNVNPILDNLLTKNVISQEDYDTIGAIPTTQEKMRKLYRGPLKAAGHDGKDVFYRILEEKESYLVADLKRQGS